MSDLNSEKKFTCSKCNYTAQVAGEEYFEIEFSAIVGTRKCNSCNRLFDIRVSEVITQEEMNLQHKEYLISNNYKRKYQDNPLAEFNYFLSTLKATKNRKQVECFWCGSTNTVEWKKENPVCPKCNSLMEESAGEKFPIIDSNDFINLKDIINSSPKVVLCYIEPSCSPCRYVEALVNEINIESPNEYMFVKFEDSFDKANKLSKKYKIRLLPTFLLYNKGKFVGRFSKFTSKQNFIYQLNKRFLKKTHQ